MYRVHSHADAYADRNAFLQVTLGAISFWRALADLTLAFGPATAEAPVTASGEDRFLDAALGIASVLRLAVEAADESASLSPSPPPPPVPPAAADCPPLRSILA